MAGDVTLAGSARFISNRVAGASPKSGEHGSGGAIFVDGAVGGSTLTFGGPTMFRNNTATRGGAVTLADSRLKFTESTRSSSCWVGNHAHELSKGAALRIQALARVEFGTLAPHNFGTHIAGTLETPTRDDIVVLVNGSYVCGEDHGEVNSYSVEGNMCSAQCSAQHTCKCPLGHKFDALKCSCQSAV
jgi:hypothetical protein